MQTWQPMWQPVSSAPLGRHIGLAVIEGGEAHALVFPCHRTDLGWVSGETGKLVEVYPTHWREWPANDND